MTNILSPATTITAAIILLTVVAIAYGGVFLMKVSKGNSPTNDLQKTFFRAGHAHAGVLVILGLVIKLYFELAAVSGVWAALSSGVLWAAILMPAGFFLSVLGRDPKRPSKLIALLWLGAASLVVGLVSASIGLLLAA